ncbi:MAG: hypothetical protein AAF462_08855 [Thermodesulfobacteriota bacterium]
MSEEQQGQGKDQVQMDSLQNSILMAFNLGVQYNQQTQGTKSVTEVVGELGHNIYSNLTDFYGEKMQDEVLRANTEYFLQIAMMGYIVPSVCAYDEEFKNRLLQLVEMRAKQTEGEQTSGNIITT